MKLKHFLLIIVLIIVGVFHAISVQAVGTKKIEGFSTHPSGTCGGNNGYYNALLATGATSQRFDASWWIIQPNNATTYNWTPVDCPVNDATAKGISTTLIINEAPPWAGYNSCNGYSNNCPPANTATFATFCSALATHFLGRVKYYEIYNEPNVETYSKDLGMARYVADLNACGSAIKLIDPTAKIISAGFAPAPTVASSTTSIMDSVNKLYALGAQFDILGAHPYSYPWGIKQGLASENGWQAMIYERTVMNAHGDSSKPIWITEVGAPTCGPGNALNLGDNGNEGDYMTLTAQSQLAQQIIATSTSPWMNIGKIFWYTLVDANSNDHSDPENCFGTYYSNGQKKPSFTPIKNS